jgi:hypothetical protein
LHGDYDSRRIDWIAGWKRSNPRFHRRKLDIWPIKTAAFIDQKSFSPAKNRIFRHFPAIFRGQISRCGIFWGENFSTGDDFKGVKNNLQDSKENLYPWGVFGGWGTPFSVVSGQLSVTTHASGPCSFFNCAPDGGNYLQGLAVQRTPSVWLRTGRPGGRASRLRFVVSHPFRKLRGKDGAPKLLG